MRPFGLDFERTVLRPPSYREWDRLITLRRGACLARARDRVAAVTPERGLLVAGDMTVDVHVGQRVEFRMVYLLRDAAAPAPGTDASDGARMRSVTVTPLLRELVERVVERGALDADETRDRRLIGVLVDEVAALPNASYALALPRDPRALRVAERVLAQAECIAARDVAGERPSLAALVGAGTVPARTLDRLFAAETGLALGRWRRRAYLLAAARAVAVGASVTAAGFDAGYAAPSAFIAAFRREFGVTPGRARSRRDG